MRRVSFLGLEMEEGYGALTFPQQRTPLRQRKTTRKPSYGSCRPRWPCKVVVRRRRPDSLIPYYMTICESSRDGVLHTCLGCFALGVSIYSGGLSLICCAELLATHSRWSRSGRFSSFFFACYTHIQVLTNCKSCFISNVIISISPPRDACCKEAVCDVGYLLDVAVNVLGG